MEEFEGSDEPGGVQVVAASVHPPRGGREVESGRLGDGQSVHVPAQEDGGYDPGRVGLPGSAAQDDDADVDAKFGGLVNWSQSLGEAGRGVLKVSSPVTGGPWDCGLFKLRLEPS